MVSDRYLVDRPCRGDPRTSTGASIAREGA
jgi:hypothetical protein